MQRLHSPSQPTVAGFSLQSSSTLTPAAQAMHLAFAALQQGLMASGGVSGSSAMATGGGGAPHLPPAA